MENGTGPNILVIDGEQDMLDCLFSLLQRQGFQVRTACTGIEGIAQARDPVIDLVLLEVMLPDMSGFDVCLRIKETRPLLPVICLTVRDKPIDVVTGLDSGADDFITKQCPSSVLLARIRAALRASRQGNADTRPGVSRQDPKVDMEQSWRASELLPIISHELRTPIAAMKGFITTLLSNYRHWDDYECEAFLRKTNECADDLSQLIENVLEMGRLDKGLELHRRPTQLASLVQRVLRDFSFQSGHCEFESEIPAHLPMLAIDPLKIERVLRNLLENSIKFSPQGGKIRILAELVEKEIVVGVEDEGIGIAPEHLPHIFERFYQAGQGGAPKDGVGLGLSIVRELIQAHGGRVRAESEPGNGATVYFTLPTNGSMVTSGHTSLESERTGADLNDWSTWRYALDGHPLLLVVEDDKQMIQSLKKGLESQGFEILTTAYGSEAIDLVRSEKPDLVLLDLLLPDIDGLAVCERLRRFSDVPIIMITGKTAESYRVRGLDQGADDFLIKPFSNEELLARIRSVLRRTWVPGSIEPPSCLRFNGLEIDPTHYEVKTAEGPVRLTPTEHKLLFYLASNAGRILTHQQLLTRVWGYECEHQIEYLWVNISRLRKKIEPQPSQPCYILTEPGIGYCFTEPNKTH